MALAGGRRQKWGVGGMQGEDGNRCLRVHCPPLRCSADELFITVASWAITCHLHVKAPFCFYLFYSVQRCHVLPDDCASLSIKRNFHHAWAVVRLQHVVNDEQRTLVDFSTSAVCIINNLSAPCLEKKGLKNIKKETCSESSDTPPHAKIISFINQSSNSS